MDLNNKISLNKIKVFDIILAIFMVIIVYMTLYPFLINVFASVSNPEELVKNPILLYPRSFSLKTYSIVLSDSRLLLSFKNSMVYSVTTTILAAFLTTAAAYALSVKTFRARKFFMKMFLIPMFFGGGLIPSYLVMQSLGLINSMWAIILPSLVGTFNLILVKTFIEELPTELFESAVIDGANEVFMFFKMVIPLSLPIIATISLWTMVGQWNSYFGPLLYFTDPNKYPLQVFLRELLSTALLSELMDRGTAAVTQMADIKSQMKSDSLKAAIIVVSSIPIIIMYPFVQRFFIKGIMIGAIKG